MKDTLTSLRPADVSSWKQATPIILPSLLLCDFGNLEAEVRRLEAAGVKALHLDVMDGHFVHNLTYGVPIVEAVRRITKMPLDVHLMISQPASYVDEFVDAGADAITFHVEAEGDPADISLSLRARGVLASIALNPPTPLEAIVPLLSLCDMVLVMSVMPGFGGQTFRKSRSKSSGDCARSPVSECCWKSMAASTPRRFAAVPRPARNCSLSDRPFLASKITGIA